MGEFSHRMTVNYRQKKSVSGKKALPEIRQGLSFSRAGAYLEAASTMATEIRQISSSSSVGMTATFTRLSSVEM